MVQLVNLTNTKLRLRIDTNDDDTLLESLIDVASAAVITYLKSQAAEVIDLTGLADSPADVTVAPVIQQATILLVDYYFRGEYESAEPGYLPPPVMALLYPLRDPAMA